jgi:agmatine deiminase
VTAAATTPAALGLRWPAEWERHAATWLVWPHNPETWPGRLEQARAAYAVFVRELHERETVRLLVRDAQAEAGAARALARAGVDVARVELHRVPTDDAWIRDTGPIFLVRDGPAGRERVLADFRFDSWGGKYPPYDLDDAVPRAVERALGLARLEAGFVLEGGSVDGDGDGTLLTTASCLLNPNREKGRRREQMERRLAEWLGARQVVWLGDGILGDDTDGHVDDIARFVAPGTVVAAVEEDAVDPNHGPLAENLRRLRAARDRHGKPLAVATLPMPPAVLVDGLRCPASYANFYLANGCALVPTFGVAQDRRALAVLRELLPQRDVVGVPSRDLVQGLGALHCLSQQEPAADPA